MKDVCKQTFEDWFSFTSEKVGQDFQANCAVLIVMQNQCYFSIQSNIKATLSYNYNLCPIIFTCIFLPCDIFNKRGWVGWIKLDSKVEMIWFYKEKTLLLS